MLLLARLAVATAAVAVVASIPVATARERGIPGRSGGRRQTLTERGTDKLPLGRTLAAVRRLGFVGRLRSGCELASPRPYVASLRRPLIGTATFSGDRRTSRLIALSIRAGVITSRGVVLGLSAGYVLRRYPHAQVRRSPRGSPVRYRAVVVERGGRDRMWFLLDARGLVKSFEIPRPQLCE